MLQLCWPPKNTIHNKSSNQMLPLTFTLHSHLQQSTTAKALTRDPSTETKMPL